MTGLTDDQLDRYARHLVLREIGGAGQAAIRSSTIAVIGAGGIGAPVLQYLAAAGVRRLTIIDDDKVSLSNLQRQVIFDTTDVGLSKADCARERVIAINPDVNVTVIEQRLTADNAD